MTYLRTIFFFGMIMLSSPTLAQQSYEWMQMNTPYLRIKTYQSGIYYLTLSSLSDAGLPANIDPHTFRIFHRGQEQQLLVSGEADGVFDNIDTVYFYGQRNDGTLDTFLYQPSTSPLNPSINLHSDTTVYFLSWGGQQGLRMSSPLISTPTSATHHQEHVHLIFHDEYARGTTMAADVSSSKFDAGEGWCSFSFFVPYTLNFPLKDLQPGIDATLEINVIGRNDYGYERKILVKVGDPLDPDFKDTIRGFSQFEKAKFSCTIPAVLLSGTNLQVTLEPLGNDVYVNYISLTDCRLSYPQSLNTAATHQKTYHVTGNTTAQQATLNWNSALALAFDLTNPNQVNTLPFTQTSTTLSVAYPEHCDSFIVINRTALLKPHEIQYKQYALPNINSDYCIVSHPILQNSVQQYADYRRSTTGGSYTVSVEWILDLYDLFSYGEETPLALFRYGQYLATNSSQARFLVLIGNGLDVAYYGAYGYYRWNPAAYYNEPDVKARAQKLIPSAGNPGSDLLFVMDDQLHPHFAIGRIQGKNDAQVMAYLNKVIEHETGGPYKKHLIHLSGGNNNYESTTFSSEMNNFKSIVENSIWDGRVILSFHKTDFSAETEISISDKVNSGLSFITFYGHASNYFTDPNFGYVSDDTKGFMNRGRYPMLILNGCDAGNIFTQYSVVEDWVMTPDRGAIVALGPSQVTYASFIQVYTPNLYQHLFNKQENIGIPVGEIINHHLNDPAISLHEFIQTQMILCGDPAIIVNANPEITSLLPKQTMAISISPNPNEGKFSIESTFEGTLEILNANGTVIHQDMITPGIKEFHTNLPSGIYLVRFTNASRSEYLKVVVF